MTFMAETKMVANAWMRNGNIAASIDFEGFFDELLEIIPVKRIGYYVPIAVSMVKAF